MTVAPDHDRIRVLVADDDEGILECYQAAFRRGEPSTGIDDLESLEQELFSTPGGDDAGAHFEIVACRQGRDAISLAAAALEQGRPFDVVILDVRMPPGIDGVEAGSRIRELDPTAEIIFVSGYSDVPPDELARRVPPPVKLHYFHKPLSFMRLAEDVVSLVRAP